MTASAEPPPDGPQARRSGLVRTPPPLHRAGLSRVGVAGEVRESTLLRRLTASARGVQGRPARTARAR